MTLIVELSKTEEARLNAAAKISGVRPEEYTRQLIASLPAAPSKLSSVNNLQHERHRGLDELVAESEQLGLNNLNLLLAEMAKDPQIQRENQLINCEFALYERDGLDDAA